MVINILRRVKQSTIGRSIKVLPKGDRKKLTVIVAIQIMFGFLDLAGVAVIGVIGALAVSGVKSGTPGNRVSEVLNLLHLSNFEFQSQVAILGMIAATLLVGRTIFSVFFTRRILFFLSRRGAYISSELAYKWLSQPLTVIQSRSTQETVYALTFGVQTITLGVLATFINFVTDAMLLLILLAGLIVVDVVTAFTTFLLFTIISFVIYRTTSARSVSLGLDNASLSIKSNEKIVEVLTSYRESVVRNRREYYAREIGKLRQSIANVSAEMSFMPNISKYVIESSVIIGAVVISGIQFMLQDATHAIATLAVFMAAGTRIAPAVMRMQQGIIQIKTSIGSATPTLDMIDSLGNSAKVVEVSDQVDTEHSGFYASIDVKNLSWTYPNATVAALSDINFQLSAGESVAFVGPSGAGKTTLVDAILGVLPLDSGLIRISTELPSEAVRRWPGAIAYVPQDVLICDATIRQNVALGFPDSEATDELVWSAIDVAQLREFVESLPDGLDSEVGERGMRISGGQRQRLGIARAMFTKPKLLVLDEATSSLDGQTESDISSAIHGLKGSVTVVMIAHRLSMVREADRVVYLEQGRVLAIGTFEEVRKSVPDFDRQAFLMGL
jgi:ABC-type multidrug transport system fused ATPase/permease subunit